LPERITGANISLHALCQRLSAGGEEPVVVCGKEAGGSGPLAHAPAPRYPVLRLAQPLDALTEMIDRLKPAAAVVRGPWPAAEAIARAGSRKLHIYFESSLLGHDFPSPRAMTHLRYAACSRFLAALVTAYVGGSVAIIPPLIEPEHYRCAPQDDAILFVNPVAAKGVHIAAAIAERLEHRRFLFVKAWPDQDRAPHIPVRLPNVEWVESSLDMRALYGRARLLLVPSIWEEGFGRVIVEAQISGIPCVASDRGALPDTVGEGGVVLSLAEPVERWCAAVESLFSDGRRYGECAHAARANALRADLAPDAVVARFLDFVST
jgi:glycosyltransferase involved in cell wall biosynthesis